MKVDRWVSIAYSSSVSFHMEAHTDIGLPSTIVSDLLYILSDLIRALSISWGLVSCPCTSLMWRIISRVVQGEESTLFRIRPTILLYSHRSSDLLS